MIRSPALRRRLAAGLASLAVTAHFFSGLALAGNSPQGDSAAAWPSNGSWTAYTYADGTPIVDAENEVNPPQVDIASNGGTAPSVYVSTTGSDVFFRLRLRADPRDDSKGGFDNAFWLVQIATASDDAVRAVVGLNGKPVSTDFVYVSNTPGSAVTQIYTTPFDTSGGQDSRGARALSDGDGQFFLDFQVPISRIVTASGGAITSSTPVKFFVGSSTANNLATINKDYMTGSSVNFSDLATWTLAGGPAEDPANDDPADDDPEDPANDDPADDDSVDQDPSDDPANDDPAHDDPADPGPSDDPANDDPADQDPADQANDDPADQDPSDDPAHDDPADYPADDYPADDYPADDYPADDNPSDQNPTDDPADQDPADQDPADQDPADQDPADQDPADPGPSDDPADDDPVDQDPSDDPANDDPANDDPAEDDHPLPVAMQAPVKPESCQTAGCEAVTIDNAVHAVDPGQVSETASLDGQIGASGGLEVQVLALWALILGGAMFFLVLLGGRRRRRTDATPEPVYS